MKGWRTAGNLLLVLGVILIAWFAYAQFNQAQMQHTSMEQAQLRIDQEREGSAVAAEKEFDDQEQFPSYFDEDVSPSFASSSDPQMQEAYSSFEVEDGESFGILDIEALDRSLPVVEGTGPDDLDRGVGHLRQSSLPGGGEQILLSGHRDTVFRNFGELKIGDTFDLHMPYGSFRYEIKSTEIVPEDDRTVIRDMGEEVLVVTTCYPFDYINHAPERFVVYAYPVEETNDH
jgi:sortase A